MLGGVGIATAVFFVDLHQPWYYFWMYAGVVMRLVLLVQRKPAKVPVTSASDVPLRLPTSRRDPYGWAQPRCAHERTTDLHRRPRSLWDVVGRRESQYIGGESIQHVLLARAWRDLGHDVRSSCTTKAGQRRVHDGITAIAAQSRDGGIPGLRFFHPRATRLLSALIAADADTYYQSPAGAYTGITGWFCRATGRRFIFRIASDSDCEKEHGRIQFWRDRKLFNYGLRCANVIASQTELQAQMLRENHGLESTVVNMMVEMPRRSARTEGHRCTVGQQFARAQTSRTRARARASVAGGQIHAGGRTDAWGRDLLR